MSLNEAERATIVALKIEKSRDVFEQAKGISELNYWSAVANRLYYACFHAVSALLVHKKLTAHTHSGVIRLFGLHFVSKEIISNEHGKLYSKLFEMRQAGDYDDFVVIEKDDVVPLIDQTKVFIDTIIGLIE